MKLIKQLKASKLLSRETLSSEEGLTLMELIISILLLSIISLAAFSGLQYAYYIISSSSEFIEETYDVQHDFEIGLSYTYSGEVSDITGITAITDIDAITENSVIEFTWDTNGLYHFDSYGYILEREAGEDSYLDEILYFYIPVVTSGPAIR